MKAGGQALSPPRLAILSIGVGEPSETIPLGAASVAAALSKAFGARLVVSLAEASPTDEAGLVASRLLEKRPDFIGLSVYTWNRRKMADVVAALGSKGFAGPLFAGGPEASAEPFDIIAELGLDFTVVGEGEESSVAAFEALLGPERGLRRTKGRMETDAYLDGLPGIALPGKKEAFKRRQAPGPESLASPWLAGTASPRGRDEVVWELSRGCAFHCTYCYEGRGEGGVRVFPKDRIEAELELLARGGTERIFVLDPTFNWKRERALDLLALFAARGKGMAWKFEVRAELLDRALAQAFARLDVSIQIGLQSSDPQVLAKVGRPGFDAERFAAKVALLDAEGLTWGLDLIYGLPGDTLRGFAKSVDYALGLAPNHLDIFPLTVLPGTELAEEAAGFGLGVDREAPHLLLGAPGFPAEAMARARDIAIACDLFYSKGRAVAWFLRALAPLKARPSTFLARFGDWLGRQGPKAGALGVAEESNRSDHRSIESLQLAFLEAEYRERNLEPLWPLLRDSVRFEGAWTRAVAEGESSVLELAYGPDTFADPPCAELRELARLCKPRPSRIRLRPGRSGPAIEVLR